MNHARLDQPINLDGHIRVVIVKDFAQFGGSAVCSHKPAVPAPRQGVVEIHEREQPRLPLDNVPGLLGPLNQRFGKPLGISWVVMARASRLKKKMKNKNRAMTKIFFALVGKIGFSFSS